MKCVACGQDVAKNGFSGAQLKRSATQGRTCKACVASKSASTATTTAATSSVVAVKEEDTRTEEKLMAVLKVCLDGKLSAVKRLTTRPGVDIDRQNVPQGFTAL